MKDCFGTFRDKDNCLTCEENYNCFIKTMKGEQCFIKALDNKDYACDTSICTVSPVFGAACLNVRSVLRQKEKCKYFSEKIKEQKQIENCLKCHPILLTECMASRTLRKTDLSKEARKIKEELHQQIEEIKTEDGSCFGLPQFEESCWGCDFLLPCKKEAGIVPGIECSFSKIGNNDICTTCPFVKSCGKLLKEETTKKKEEEKKKEMFKTFYDLNTIRGIARNKINHLKEEK